MSEELSYGLFSVKAFTFSRKNLTVSKQKLFLEEIKNFDVSYINYGSETGYFVGVNRRGDDKFHYEILTPNLPAFSFYEIDADGSDHPDDDA